MQHSYTYQKLAEAFTRESANTCFALLGDANMNWATHIATLGTELIYVRDEHCAVAAAMAWARSTNEVGVASVTCGPGLTQILTALPAAVRANIPLIVFAGEAPLSKPWYNQAIEQRPFVEACGAEYVALHHPKTMLTDIRDAFLKAKSQRKVIVIGAPFDLQHEQWNEAYTFPAPALKMQPPVLQPAPNKEQLSLAVDRISQSARIVVMAGLGAVAPECVTACKALASSIGGLLATTLPARGLFYDDPFCLGIVGGFSNDVVREYIKSADLVIAVGASLAAHNSDNGALFRADQVLHIDIDAKPVQHGRMAATQFLQCDASLGVSALLEHFGGSKRSADSDWPWRNELIANDIKHSYTQVFPTVDETGYLDPNAVVQALNTALPSGAHCVNSSGHCSYFAAQMPGRPNSHFLTIREFGAIGNGIAFAIGAAVAHPDRTVVLFDGDGSLMMHVQELETIVRHQLNIVICVLNDGAYGSEIHKLRAEGLSDAGAVFGRPSFASIAQGFGVSAKTFNDATSLSELAGVLTSISGATVLDFHISDKIVSPVIQRSHSTKG